MIGKSVSKMKNFVVRAQEKSSAWRLQISKRRNMKQKINDMITTPLQPWPNYIKHHIYKHLLEAQ
jgi:hypothetical protein